MNTKHTVTVLGAAAVLAAAAAFGPSATAADTVKVGVLLSADDARYRDGAEAAIKQLRSEGVGEGAVTGETRNAKGDKKAAAAMAKELASGGARVVLAMGTGAAGGALEALKETPVVFSMVWDPLDAGFVKSLDAPGGTATGSTSKVPMASIIRTLQRIAPVKRLGVLYNPAERNSVAQLEELKAARKDLKFEIVEAVVPKKEDAASVTKSLVGKVDAIHLSGAVVVTSQVPAITAVAAANKLPTSTHLIDAVEAGALVGVTANVQDVGRIAGAKLAKVLRGEKPAVIAVEGVKKFDVSVNMKTAKAAGIKVPIDLLQSASRVIR